MSLGNLSVNITANIDGYLRAMEQASTAAERNMGQAENASEDAYKALLRASVAMEQAAKAMASQTEAANDAIGDSCENAVEAIESVQQATEKAQFDSLGEKIVYAISKGVGAGIEVARTGFEKLAELAKTKTIIISAIIAAAFAAVGLGAIYAAYKVIKAISGFVKGLFTGESYKSENIDALIQAEQKVRSLQESLKISAQEAGALGDALRRLDVDKSSYVQTFNDATKAMRFNREELDRLGVSYKDANGNLLTQEQFLQNAKTQLEAYTAGWDRQKAAAAIGVGSYETLVEVLKASSAEIAKSKQRLDDYNLGIGKDTQDAVARYQQAMRDFDNEIELTSQGFKRAIADAIMPALTDLAEWFSSGWPSIVQTFRVGLASVMTVFYVFKNGIYFVAESILGVIEGIAKALLALGTGAVKALQGDLTGAASAVTQGWEAASKRILAIGSNIIAQAKHNNQAIKMAWALDDRSGNGKSEANPKKGKAWAGKPDDPPYDPFPSALQGLRREVAGLQYATDHFEKFNGQLKESKVALIEFDLAFGKFSDTARAADKLAPLTAAQKEQMRAAAQQIDVLKQLEKQKEVAFSFDKALDKMRLETSLLTQSTIARETAVELLALEAAGIARGTEEYQKRAQALMAAKQAEQSTQLSLKQSDTQFNWHQQNTEKDFQTSLVGKTSDEAERLNAQFALEQELRNKLHEAQKIGLDLNSAEVQAMQSNYAAQKQITDELILQDQARRRSIEGAGMQTFRQHLDNVSNAGKNMGAVMVKAFDSAADAITNFALTGKLNFRSFVSSIIADIAKMLIQMALVNAMKSAFDSSTGGGSILGSMFSAVASAFGGGKASGGPVTADKFYLVGENGPELFAPNTSGTIIPNHVLKRTPSATGTIHTNNSAKTSTETPITVIVNAQTGQSRITGHDGDLTRFGQLIGDKVREIIMTEKHQGGLLAV